jgi:hypothetical protein
MTAAMRLRRFTAPVSIRQDRTFPWRVTNRRRTSRLTTDGGEEYLARQYAPVSSGRRGGYLPSPVPVPVSVSAPAQGMITLASDPAPSSATSRSHVPSLRQAWKSAYVV